MRIEMNLELFRRSCYTSVTVNDGCHEKVDMVQSRVIIATDESNWKQ